MRFLRLFFRILSRNFLFLGGGRGPTPGEVSESGDNQIYAKDPEPPNDDSWSLACRKMFGTKLAHLALDKAQLFLGGVGHPELPEDAWHEVGTPGS
jgi:hypothetical protein